MVHFLEENSLRYVIQISRINHPCSSRHEKSPLNFNKLIVTDSSFNSLDLSLAEFVESRFSNVHFFDCLLGGAQFDRAYFENVVIEESVTTASTFNDIWVEKLTFKNTALSDARMRVLSTWGNQPPA